METKSKGGIRTIRQTIHPCQWVNPDQPSVYPRMQVSTGEHTQPEFNTNLDCTDPGPDTSCPFVPPFFSWAPCSPVFCRVLWPSSSNSLYHVCILDPLILQDHPTVPWSWLPLVLRGLSLSYTCGRHLSEDLGYLFPSYPTRLLYPWGLQWNSWHLTEHWKLALNIRIPILFFLIISWLRWLFLKYWNHTASLQCISKFLNVKPFYELHIIPSKAEVKKKRNMKYTSKKSGKNYNSRIAVARPPI